MVLDIIDDLVKITKNVFSYKENPDKDLREYYSQVIYENRLMYLYDKDNCIGFLTYFLWDKNKMNERLNKDGTFDYPEHNVSGDTLYIDHCILFNKGKLFDIRKRFRSMYPHIKEVCWHRTIGNNRKLFRLNYHGGN